MVFPCDCLLDDGIQLVLVWLGQLNVGIVDGCLFVVLVWLGRFNIGIVDVVLLVRFSLVCSWDNVGIVDGWLLVR